MANHNDINSMLTISEVAHLLNVHINTIRRWSNQGILKSYRIGSRGDRRFRQEDIDSFLVEGNKDIRAKEDKTSFDRLGTRV
jgi:excisionase family DNA binding protein